MTSNLPVKSTAARARHRNRKHVRRYGDHANHANQHRRTARRNPKGA